jgi:hypothetical protein
MAKKDAEPRIPVYARYNWWPISVTLGLTATALVLMQLTGGNHNGASKTPGVDTMPEFPVVYPVADKPENAVVPDKAGKLSAWVCRDFVIADSEHNEVIVNPIVDPRSQLPYSVADIDAAGIELAKPQQRDHYIVYRYIGGRLVQDDANRLNQCFGDVEVTATQVDDADGQASRYVLTDSATKVSAGDDVADDPATALRQGLVHQDFTMRFSDMHALLTDMQE